MAAIGGHRPPWSMCFAYRTDEIIQIPTLKKKLSSKTFYLAGSKEVPQEKCCKRKKPSAKIHLLIQVSELWKKCQSDAVSHRTISVIDTEQRVNNDRK